MLGADVSATVESFAAAGCEEPFLIRMGCGAVAFADVLLAVPDDVRLDVSSPELASAV